MKPNRSSTSGLPTLTPSPIAWTIAGSDSGGGAGIQADLKVMSAFGVHGCSVITALTAQNTLGVQAVEPVSTSMLRAQLDALAADLPPAVIKIGMLGGLETCTLVAEFLQTVEAPVVLDPVLKSTSGTDLLNPAAIDILIREIFPRVTVLTPNLPETELLTGHAIESVEEAADEILAMGVESVLIKGGHAEGDECCDFWSAGGTCCWLTSPRIETRHTHGTGCILSAAIASAIALGQDTMEAVQTAKSFMNDCLLNPANVGAGHGAMMIKPPTIR
ncbi:Hydroxymethylpyrimidine/phosphomethylpyrimidine kinase [Pontiella desulfatans]|uniref:hydroxymethylpyrimidine kinase n=1 Tax=Pontiella desulfatans TaxID=2750659 RepID=A0A6C2U908_PONDE|nr:bifunctional hydroxymethylpyrimidine kinase/phosphomethylpyrimidine kinase [Pontiella desulfatans]VGO15991.1 Hydroxymethylpyrimidine/phosphomethylpyrimidine kinase [Pontiella desulfatans]